MTLVCTIGEEIEISVASNESGLVAHAALGYDDEKNMDYSLVAGFRIVPGEIEYYFYLVSADNNTGDIEYYHEGLRTKRFIRSEDRNDVLSALCAASDALLDHNKPERFFRITYEEDLPDKALEKHHLLTRLFETRGYRIEKYDVFHGKRTWVMELAAT